MAVTIKMPVGLVGLAQGPDGFGYAFDIKESAVLFMDPELVRGNNYLEQDPESGYWIWWMDYI
jgi:hypothetical protein